jgi:hypothetical protein
LVSVRQGYASLLPARSVLRRLDALTIRGRPAVLYEFPESPGQLAIYWTEENGLNVEVGGEGIGREELLAVANGMASG